MSEAYLGEIRMFAGNYAPDGWAVCNGQTTFALPDLQGRLPIHTSPQYFLGRKGGSETVSLTLAELPAHTHPVGQIQSLMMQYIVLQKIMYGELQVLEDTKQTLHRILCKFLKVQIIKTGKWTYNLFKNMCHLRRKVLF